MEILQGHVAKPSNGYDVDEMIQEKNVSINQLNLDEDLPTRNMLSALAPKQNDIKICDVINESIGNSSNRTKVNATDDILCTINNNFVNAANNKFFNSVNKEFLDKIKSLSQLNEHEVNTNVTDIDFIVNCITKNTNRVNRRTFTSTCGSPVGIYMFKVNNRNTRTRCEICSKLIIKTPERCHWRHSGLFIVNFEHISHLVLTFLLLTSSR